MAAPRLTSEIQHKRPRRLPSATCSPAVSSLAFGVVEPLHPRCRRKLRLELDVLADQHCAARVNDLVMSAGGASVGVNARATVVVMLGHDFAFRGAVANQSSFSERVCDPLTLAVSLPK